jgi:hypothetical protein
MLTMSKELMAVEYIGTKPKKKDNVMGSGAVWNGQGDVQFVAESIGRVLCARFSAIWRETDKEPSPSQESSGFEEVDLIINKLRGMADSKKIRKYLKGKFDLTFTGNPKVETMLTKAREHMSLLADNEALAKKKVADDEANKDEVFNGVEVTEQLQPLLGLAQAGGFSTDPEEAVNQAIDVLGGVDSGFYDLQSGMPSQQAVQLLVGPEMGTAERIDTVMANRTDPEQ